MLKAWLPATLFGSGVVRGGDGTFKRWGLVEGRCVIGGISLKRLLCLCLSVSLCFLGTESSSCSPCHIPGLHSWNEDF